jgi:hypothetical protein
MNTAQIDEKLIPRLSKKCTHLPARSASYSAAESMALLGSMVIPKAPALSEVRCCVF